MMTKTLLTAAAAMALLAGGAHAGEGAKKAKPAAAAATQSGTDTSGMASDAPSDMNADAANPPMSADSAPSAASATSSGVDTAANANIRVVTNGPVADTPENREKFPPLSRTGRATKPKGN